jgi:hypothetical protein
MIKNILIGIAFLIFVLVNALLFNSDIDVTVNTPEKVKPSSEFDVEVKIKRGSVTGFAKLEFELPEGITATAVINNNASFTFSDRKIKFIWMSLPAEDEFTVNFKLAINSAVSDEFNFSGNFSYLANNNKKVFQIPLKTIKIEGANEEADEGKELLVETVTPLSVTCQRLISEDEVRKREFYVEIKINMENLSGFAKLQDVLPEGFNATAVNSKGASFSFVDQKVKFVWMSLPDENEISVSYLVKVNPEILGSYFLNGDFSYVDENGDTKKYVLPAYAITYPIEDVPLVEIPEENNNSLPDQKIKEKQKIQSADNTEIQPPQSNGVLYRVQIAATHRLVKPEYFSKKYAIATEIYTEMHEGWNKYTIGGYPEYRAARDNREQVKTNNNLNTGPFVTAYNNGQRITVQEALMISSQKWVK